MPELEWLFSSVCGQNPWHTWVLGGGVLPCCQRCTGLYAGVFAAAVLHVFVQPRFTRRLLWVHGMFLLVMVPFGYHWVPQESVIRTLTGYLFGAGLVTFLGLSFPGAAFRRIETASSGAPAYFLGLALGAGWLLAAVFLGGVWTAWCLRVVLVLGLAFVLVLIFVNLWIYGLLWLRWVRRLVSGRGGVSPRLS